MSDRLLVTLSLPFLVWLLITAALGLFAAPTG
jgi:hypothetical protein